MQLLQQLEVVREHKIVLKQVGEEIELCRDAPKQFNDLTAQLEHSVEQIEELSEQMRSLEVSMISSGSRRRTTRNSNDETQRLIQEKAEEIEQYFVNDHAPILKNMLSVCKWLPIQTARQNNSFIAELDIYRDRLSEEKETIERLFEDIDMEHHATLMKQLQLQAELISFDKNKFSGTRKTSEKYRDVSGLKGKVFKARSADQNRVIVFKEYHLPRIGMQSKEEKSAIVQCFKELQALCRLKHPYIIELEQYFFDEEKNCMVLQFPYMRNGSLREYYERKGDELRFEERIELTKQILCAMIYLHSNNILHRDIKEDNILIGDLGQAILSDFDISKDMKHIAMTSTFGVKGTDGYMAPEIRGNVPLYSKKSDIYALGVTMIKLFFPQTNIGLIDAGTDGLTAMQPKNMTVHETEVWELCKTMIDLNYELRPLATDILAHGLFSRSITSFFNDNKLMIDSRTQDEQTRQQIVSLRRSFNGRMDLTVKRENLVNSFLSAVKRADIAHFLRPTNFTFEGESGIDARGLTREAFSLLFKHVSEQTNCDLFRSEGGSLLPGKDSQQFSEAFGKVLARMLLYQEKMTCNLHIVVYEFLVGNELQILQYFDSTSNLSRLLAYLSYFDEGKANQLNRVIAFGIETVFSGYQPELTDGTAVTNANQSQYVLEEIRKSLIDDKLTQLRALRAGIIANSQIASIVNGMSAQRLKLALEASLDITPQQVIDKVNFIGGANAWREYGNGRRTSTDLIEVLRQMDSKYLSKFIMFCTGSATLCDDGTRIQVVFLHSSDNLPASHTCGKQLDLPDYQNIDVLKDKLLLAIESDAGFGFA